MGAFLQTKDGVSDQSKQMNQDLSLSLAWGLSGPQCPVSYSGGARAGIWGVIEISHAQVEPSL